MTSKYQQLKKAGLISRGRSKKKMTKEEIKDREERAKIANRQRQEARRRASIILQKSYKDEFDDLYQRELEELKSAPEQN
jgi:site-specific DNA-adenine methylase